MTVSTTTEVTTEGSADLARRRFAIGFMNWAHALDHFVILIYPTVVLELEVVYGRSYSARRIAEPPTAGCRSNNRQQAEGWPAQVGDGLHCALMLWRICPTLDCGGGLLPMKRRMTSIASATSSLLTR